MNGSEYFQLIHGEGGVYGEFIASGVADAPGDKLERGTLMQYEDETHAVAANGDFIGFLHKKVSVDGPTFEQMTLGYKNHPALAGHAVTVERLDVGDMIDVEGEPSKAYTDSSLGLLVTSGDGAITGATALNTQLSAKGGRLYVAQTGDKIRGILREHLTAWKTNGIRIRVEIVNHGIKS